MTLLKNFKIDALYTQDRRKLLYGNLLFIYLPFINEHPYEMLYSDMGLNANLQIKNEIKEVTQPLSLPADFSNMGNKKSVIMHTYVTEHPPSPPPPPISCPYMVIQTPASNLQRSK